MRIALGIEYNGARYHGWQRQSHTRYSVQEHLETALSGVADESISVACAGRTDAGVHATGQVVHFDTEAPRIDRAWLMGTNAKLPGDICVRWVRMGMDEDFHARYAALSRRYRYIICNTPQRPAILREGLSWHYRPLDVGRMREASRHFLGEQDFSSLRAAGCQSKSPWRNIYHLEVERRGDFVIIDVCANAFLHHMVRNITGLLLEIGAGVEAPGWVKEVLAARDRNQASVTAPPNGLYLVQVAYPSRFGVPEVPVGPLFLA
ncbi:MAG: tRNA pseudouridine(38-40) synthase TruA [Gammaproteobacteria bacterium]|nr:tRNA pseudouridine(38-40) synthase TruA [Gammaproteobacteria bacterium]